VLLGQTSAYFFTQICKIIKDVSQLAKSRWQMHHSLFKRGQQSNMLLWVKPKLRESRNRLAQLKTWHNDVVHTNGKLTCVRNGQYKNV